MTNAKQFLPVRVLGRVKLSFIRAGIFILFMNREILHERAENMRCNPTFHENKFRERLEIAGIFYKCQKVIGSYIVDFLVGKTIIEIDGSSHYETFQAVYDIERTKYLTGLGYKLIRVRNEHVVSFDMNRLKKAFKKAYYRNLAKKKPKRQQVSSPAEPKDIQAEMKAVMLRRKFNRFNK